MHAFYYVLVRQKEVLEEIIIDLVDTFYDSLSGVVEHDLKQEYECCFSTLQTLTCYKISAFDKNVHIAQLIECFQVGYFEDPF